MAIMTFAHFGYEGSIVTVEVGIRDGIKALDIVGLSDGLVTSTREIVRKALKDAGYDMPAKRVLVCLSPADLYKDKPMNLAVALAIFEKDMLKLSEKVLVLGGLNLDGKITSVRGAYGASQAAIAADIKHAIVPSDTEKLPDGIKVHRVGTLQEAMRALAEINDCTAPSNPDILAPVTDGGAFVNGNDSMVSFNPVSSTEETLDNDVAMRGLLYAMSIAAAGRLHMLVIGGPGSGKSSMLLRMPQILPNLLPSELTSVNRILSLTGLSKPQTKNYVRPFRIPHQTASLEGICGGGPNCNPGEISLAHNGVLFLDEAAEFRTSVLQMLRVPLETGQITLSRAGRSTTYPANFQLVMATNPCPCGNYGASDKICLCSMQSIKQYWKKFSSPLLSCMTIRYNCDIPHDVPVRTLDDTRERITRAVTRQLNRQHKFNQELTHEELEALPMSSGAKQLLASTVMASCLTQRDGDNILRIAQTICDMQEGYCNLTESFIRTAVRLHRDIPVEL
jgi:magnesium chelatase family protein